MGALGFGAKKSSMASYSRVDLQRMLVLFVAYFVAAKFGGSLDPNHSFATPFWAPSGIALAFAFFYGRKVWPAIFLAAFIYDSQGGAVMPAAVVSAFGQSLQALVGATILQRLRFNPSLDRFRDVMSLVFGAAFFSTLISPTIGVSAMALSGRIPISEFAHTWSIWWSGDLMGDLLVAPALFVWGARPRYRINIHRVELIFVSLLSLVLCLTTFDFMSYNFDSIFARAYSLFPFVFWIAMRFGPRGSATASILISIVAIVGTARGLGPFIEAPSLAASLRHLQVFLATLCVTATSVAAVICERRMLEEKLSFLSEAGRILGSSTDFHSKVNSVAKLCVPFLADWCVIDIIMENGQVHRVAVAHDNPADADLAWEMKATLPSDLKTPRGIHEVLRSGAPNLVTHVSEQHLRDGARDGDHLKRLHKIGPKSAMVVPLKARGKIMGALTLISTDSDRHYTEEDFAFAQELERRTSWAMDNSKLLSETLTANRAKDDFLAALSHELRTPLNVILGWVQVLKTEKMIGPAKDHALDTLERNAQIQVKLINDLLDVSRIVAGKFQLEKKPMDLRSVAMTALESQKMAAAAKGVILKFNAEPYLGFTAGDSLRMQQVIGNLLTNAIKFTPAGGEVRLEIKREQNNLSVSVSDTGQGILPTFLPHVFDAFRQEEGGASRGHGGLGLGLSIVKHIVQGHGGKVRAESAGKNKGSRFTVSIPLLTGKDLRPALEAERQLLADYSPDVSNPLQDVRVLLVDDSPDLLVLITHWLENSGAKVTVAKSAAEAMLVLKDNRPDVILSDIGMPGEDGYQLIQKIRNLPPEKGGMIPAAAITAYAREEEEQKALAAGFQLHLPKPIVGKDLIQAVIFLREIHQGHQSEFNPFASDDSAELKVPKTE